MGVDLYRCARDGRGQRAPVEELARVLRERGLDPVAAERLGASVAVVDDGQRRVRWLPSEET